MARIDLRKGECIDIDAKTEIGADTDKKRICVKEDGIIHFDE